MTEIKLTLKDPARSIEALRYVAHVYLQKQNAEGMVGAGANYPIVQAIADSIEEQVKADREPLEFGSLVRAGYPYQQPDTERPLWQRSYENGKHYWESDAGAVSAWSELTDVEVLRVGIGEPEPLAQWETELLNEQEVREVATAVLSAMDVDQYLIDAVTNARPR